MASRTPTTSRVKRETRADGGYRNTFTQSKFSVLSGSNTNPEPADPFLSYPESYDSKSSYIVIPNDWMEDIPDERVPFAALEMDAAIVNELFPPSRRQQ